jgi:predicted Zn-dependent protease
MPATKTDANPFLRRSPLRRLWEHVKGLRSLPRKGWRTVRGWPKIVQQLILVIGIIAAGWGAYAGYNFYIERSRNRNVNAEWVKFNNAVQQGKKEEVAAILERILAVKPDDLQAKGFKTAVETGKADPNDSNLVIYVVHDHLKNNRLDDAERECRRRLEKEPRDYYIHYRLAMIMIQKKDQANAEKEVDALALPDVNNVNLFLPAMAGAVELLRQTNKNMTQLRQMIAGQILPRLKNEVFQNADPGTQSMLLFLYGELFELPNLPPDTAMNWPAAMHLMELCLDGAKQKDSVDAVKNISGLGSRFAAGLAKLRAAAQITEPQRVDMAKDLEERNRRALQYVLEKEPKNAAAYLGVMESHFRSGQNMEGINTLLKAVDVCGDQPQLLEWLMRVTRVLKKDMEGYNRIRQAAERNPKQSVYWVLAGQAAYAADRRDLAQECLEKARAASPDDPNIRIMQASLFTGTGFPAKVLAALAGIPDADLAKNPIGAMAFVRALAEIGDTERLEAFLESARNLSEKANQALPMALAADGLLQAEPPTPERAQHVADYLSGSVERFRTQLPRIVYLHAMALARACEKPDGSVDVVKARQALIALERTVGADPNNPEINTAIIDLRLRGDNDPLKALYDTEPLMAKLDVLTPDQAAKLAKVFNANKKYDDAIRVVTPHTRARPTAGCWVQLGAAYHGQGRKAEAREALDRAAALSMSDRERAEYNAARALLTRESQ